MILYANDQLTIQKLIFMAKRIGYKPSIHHINNKYIINCVNDRIGESNDNQVTSVKNIKPENQYVYDIETEASTFNAGIGDIIVKNTDSIFCKFNTDHVEGDKHDKIKYCMEIGEIVSERITDFLRAQTDFISSKDALGERRKWTELEYEKVYHPFILFTKKRYIGWMYEFDHKEPDQLDKKGIVLKRRDNCHMVKNIYRECVDILMNDEEGSQQERIDKSTNILKTRINELLENKTPIEDLTITKSLRGSYKNRKLGRVMTFKEVMDNKTPESLVDGISLPHVRLARRMGIRDPGNKPACGDRIPYVFVEHPDKDAKQWMKSEDPSYVLEHKLRLDCFYYLEKQLRNPVVGLFEVLVPNPDFLFDEPIRKYLNGVNNNQEITKWFKSSKPDDDMSDLYKDVPKKKKKEEYKHRDIASFFT